MSRSNLVVRAWWATGAVAFVTFALGSRWPDLLVVPGLLIGTWGFAVALNWRGLADALPRQRQRRFGPFTSKQEVSPAMIRLTFAFFALWGVGLTAHTVYGALR